MNRTPPALEAPITRLDALGIADGGGVCASPGSLLLAAGGDGAVEVLAAGTPAQIDTHPASAAAKRLSFPTSILIPGLVNAHTHLDLTHIGPRPHDPGDGFVAWVDVIRAGRHTQDGAIAESVRRGIELSLAGGTVAIGDIAGAPGGQPMLAPWRAMAESGVLGVSFLEFFGIGATRERARARLEALLVELPAGTGESARLGLQPHAPNTVDRRLYEWAVAASRRHGLALSTHLAETPEEREFVATGRGPQREMLERLGVFDDSVLDHIGRGEHPVRHLRDVLGSARFVVAHVNDADDDALETLAAAGASVAYCPRASAYFHAERAFGPHRYREMLAAGINVALGTDSIVNLPPEAADPARGGMSILDEMRLLHQRDGTDGRTLLAMGTVNGAAALGLEPGWFAFSPGPLAGVVAVEAGERSAGSPLSWILRSGGPATLLLRANLSCLTRK